MFTVNRLVSPASEQTTPIADAFWALHLYYPSRTLMPAKLRAFVDFIRAANWSLPD